MRYEMWIKEEKGKAIRKSKNKGLGGRIRIRILISMKLQNENYFELFLEKTIGKQRVSKNCRWTEEKKKNTRKTKKTKIKKKGNM